jgi:serine protease AprX
VRRTLALTGLSAVLFAMAAPAQHEIVPGRTDQIHLRYASFDPAQPVDVPGLLQGAMDTRLWIVQMRGLPTQAQRDSLRRIGAEIGSYLPESAYVVRMTQAMAAAAMEIDGVRTVSYYHPAFRLEPFLLNELATRGADSMAARKYNIVVFNKHTDKPGLMARIGQLGGMTTHEQEGSILLEVSLTGNQLVQAVRFDEVLWIDRWTEPELDMDNARIQGGGNYVETAGGFTGKGVIGHIYEGLEAGHQDFTNTPINVLSAGGADTHGHCTAGIVFGNGTSNPAARGMAPDIQAYYTQYGSVTAGFSRWQVVERLTKTHQVMFTTASWGGGRTRAYTSTSASSDDIVFDHDIIWTNSQSNAGNQDSRPEAWAKNVISIGGFAHRDNSNPADDSWQAGNGSTGPAADGRIKPDLSAYYDSILCSDRTGTAGYSSGNFTTGFGRHLGRYADRRGSQCHRDPDVHRRALRPAARPQRHPLAEQAAFHDAQGPADRERVPVQLHGEQHRQPSRARRLGHAQSKTM